MNLIIDLYQNSESNEYQFNAKEDQFNSIECQFNEEFIIFIPILV